MDRNLLQPMSRRRLPARSCRSSAMSLGGGRLAKRAAPSSSGAIRGRRSRASSRRSASTLQDTMNKKNTKSPTAVLICHENDRLDTEGLASWLACTMTLARLVVITDGPGRVGSVARHELRRVGWLGFLDVLAFRLFARIVLRSKVEAWKAGEVARLRARYPADLRDVPRLVVENPNADEVRVFLERLSPDVLI